ncbi:MAG: class I SAM-dependent methyltransferase [Candidatus Kapabacteria bacterium]|jgi:cyclopropane fatty-acyl-phospholipid synthase-like methyltransferase|nr:class I SAM-dependent methyltransferase [Candidatus Kapabacteria bacterium]
MESYNQIARFYAADRQYSAVGLAELDDLLERLPKGASVLDVGCGTGKPITEAILLHPESFQVFGVDSSEIMLEELRTNFPNVPVQCAQIQEFDYFGRTFDAVVSWGMMFHLSPEEQRSVIRNITSHLAPRGLFLFTSGKEAGMRLGMMYSEEFQYFSLGAEEYRKVLEASNCELLKEHFDIGENYYYLAKKK